ncbi:MAG: right-handed parallel beta-helix repeat-containing protein [Deltaproteobacteria bacterium]|nr:right-handed parallel beta-helix repeat-containing protein [Deltaproteobacteria bacterium]
MPSPLVPQPAVVTPSQPPASPAEEALVSVGAPVEAGEAVVTNQVTADASDTAPADSIIPAPPGTPSANEETSEDPLPAVAAVETGTVYYVRPPVAEATPQIGADGRSYQTAWRGFAAIQWGDDDGNVHAGDTLYVCGTYHWFAPQLKIPATAPNGTAERPITIRGDCPDDPAQFVHDPLGSNPDQLPPYKVYAFHIESKAYYRVLHFTLQHLSLLVLHAPHTRVEHVTFNGTTPDMPAAIIDYGPSTEIEQVTILNAAKNGITQFLRGGNAKLGQGWLYSHYHAQPTSTVIRHAYIHTLGYHPQYQYHAIALKWNQSVLIEDSAIIDPSGSGISVNTCGDVGNTVIQRNTIRAGVQTAQCSALQQGSALENCMNQAYGVAFAASAKDPGVEHCAINSTVEIANNEIEGYTGNGILIEAENRGAVSIQHNTIAANRTMGIWLYSASTPDTGTTLIAGNNIHHNGYASAGSTQSGIDLAGHVAHVTVRDNLIHFNGYPQSDSNSKAAGLILQEGPQHLGGGSPQDITIQHNTFVNNSVSHLLTHGYAGVPSVIQGLDVRYNIFATMPEFGNDTVVRYLERWNDTPQWTVFDYNLHYGRSDVRLRFSDTQEFRLDQFAAYQQTTGYNQHSIVADPLFVDLQAFRLNPFSPAAQIVLSDGATVTLGAQWSP